MTRLQKKALLAKKAHKPKLPTAKQAGKSTRRSSSPLENKLWGTPGEASRTLKFTSNLLVDEEADFNGLNDASFTMPTPHKDGTTTDSGALNFTASDPAPHAGSESPAPSSPGNESEELLPAPPASTTPPEPVRKVEELESRSNTPKRAKETEQAEVAHQTPKAGTVKLGAEVERISSKIAGVYGDMLSHAQESGKRPSSTKDIM